MSSTYALLDWLDVQVPDSPAQLAAATPAATPAPPRAVMPAPPLGAPLATPRAVSGSWLERGWAFARFAFVGSASTVVTSALFLLLGAWMPATLANTVATVLTTVVSNQAHARWTFGSARRGVGMHLRAGVSVALTYPLTTLALLTLDHVDHSAGAGVEVAVLVGASAVAGLFRYLLLLVGVFPDSPAAFSQTR